MGIDSIHNARVRAGRSAAVAALLAAGFALAVPAAGQAAFQTFGSDLSAPADHTESHQRDVAFWHGAFADGHSALVPVAGQIKEIRLKGFARSDTAPGAFGGGETIVHFQSLAPTAGGALQARITSQAFDVPNRSAGSADTITTFKPENFCVQPGERIAFNSIGGWDGVMDRSGPYPDGTPMQVFGSVTGSRTSFFTADQGTNNGQVFTPRGAGHPSDERGEIGGTELLMQMTIATGDDRSYECGGPNTYRPADPLPTPKAPVAQKATLPEKQRVNVSRKGVAGLAVFCRGGASDCTGTVTIYAKAARKTVAIGSSAFSIKQKTTGKVQIKLSKAGFRQWRKRRRKLPVTIVAVTNPGTPDYQHTFKVTMKKIGSK